MRKALGLALVLLLCLVGTASAQDVKTQGDPVEILTGELWQKSSPEEKRAFIFGVDTVVAIEYAINTKIKEKAKPEGKRYPRVVSPFERGWKRALATMPRKELIAGIDAWYEQHPEGIDKPVMRVVWDEFIQPRLEQQRKDRKNAGK